VNDDDDDHEEEVVNRIKKRTKEKKTLLHSKAKQAKSVIKKPWNESDEETEKELDDDEEKEDLKDEDKSTTENEISETDIDSNTEEDKVKSKPKSIEAIEKSGEKKLVEQSSSECLKKENENSSQLDQVKKEVTQNKPETIKQHELEKPQASPKELQTNDESKNIASQTLETIIEKNKIDTSVNDILVTNTETPSLIEKENKDSQVLDTTTSEKVAENIISSISQVVVNQPVINMNPLPKTKKEKTPKANKNASDTALSLKEASSEPEKETKAKRKLLMYC
jgi:hypothetical protein